MLSPETKHRVGVNLEVRYAKTRDGVKVAYSRFGQGVPLLFVGDWWSHVERDWDLPPLAAVYERVASFADTTIFDLRGTSLSDPIPAGSQPSFDNCLDDMLAVLEATDCPNTAIFASAAGVQLALHFAARYPERVSTLVLCNGYARFLQADDYPWGMPPDFMDFMRQTFEDTWGTLEMARMGGPGVDWTPRALEAAAANIRATASPTTAAAFFPLLYENDVRHLVPKVRTRTLLMHSVANPLIPVQHSRYLATYLAEARLVELPGRDFAFWGEDRDRIVDTMQEFVTGTQHVAAATRRLTPSFSATSRARPTRRCDGATVGGPICWRITMRW